MREMIKSKKEKGIYYIKKGSKTKDWIYYCKFRWRNKLYNYRNLTEEFSVTSEKEAASKMEALKSEAKKALELGLPNPLERQKLRQIEKSKEIKKEAKRTINQHWEVFDAFYKSKKSKHTYSLYSNFYNLYIKDELGEMYPSDVKSIHLDEIFIGTSLKDTSDPYKSLLKRLLRPIFNKAIGDGEMTNSPVESYKFDLKLKPKRKKISRKTKMSHLQISKRLYNAIPKYISQYKVQREEWQQLLYLQLLSGRRYGELFKLTTDNIDYDNKRLISFEEDTKSGEESSFPIPEECQDFILNIKKGKIFKEITYGSYYMVFQRLKENALTKEIKEKYPKINFVKIKKLEKNIAKEIKDESKEKESYSLNLEKIEKMLKESISKEEFEGYEEFSKYDFQLTAHDTRSLFISTLVSLGEDSRLVDAMLDHKQDSEEIVNFYLDISEVAKNKAYQKYWKALREEDNYLEN